MIFRGKQKAQDKTPRISFRMLIIGVIFLFLASNGLTYLLVSRAQNNGQPAAHQFLSPMREYVSDNDVIVNFQSLRNYLNDKYEIDSDVSIYFESLNTGANISISKDAEFFPASLLKVPVAMAAIKKIEKGEWRWENELVVMAGDKDERFGDLHKEPVGTRFTIEHLIERLLVDSDNTAYFILLRNLEEEEMLTVYRHLGLQDFFDKEGKISAKRYAVVMRSLYHAALLSKENSAKVIDWLTRTSFKEYLEQGLPEGVLFAHKIGVSFEENVFMDAGIVYAANRPYLIIVMVHGKEQGVAQGIMKDIAEKTHKYMIEYNGNDEDIKIE